MNVPKRTFTPFGLLRLQNPQQRPANGASSNEQPSEPARIVDVERQKYLTPNTTHARLQWHTYDHWAETPGAHPTISHYIPAYLGISRHISDPFFLFAGTKAAAPRPDEGIPYSEIASQLGSSEGATRVAAHRLRRQFGDLLRGEVAETVNSPEDVEDELKHLIQAVGRE